MQVNYYPQCFLKIGGRKADSAVIYVSEIESRG